MKLKRLQNHPELSYSAPLLVQAKNGRGQTGKLAVEVAGLPPQAASSPLPKVKTPVWVKITLPYFLLALFVALAGAYLVSRVVLDSIEERFTNQLIEAGTLAADGMVQEEDRLLATWRLLAHTQGLAGAITRGDAEALHRLTLPIAANAQEEAIEILDLEGVALLSLRHRPGDQEEDYTVSQGDRTFTVLPFVQQTLEGSADEMGDKFAGLARVAGEEYFYVAGPIVDEQGDLAGALLVGKSLSSLVRQIRQETLAHVTIYNLAGQPLTSTLPPSPENVYTLSESQVADVLSSPDAYSGLRHFTVGSIDYSEIVGPWALRGGQNHGLMSVALPQTFLVSTSHFTRLQIFFLVTFTFLLILAVGVYLANRITQPLLRMVRASTEVAQGNLEVRVEATGNDEVAVLTHAFNQMVAGLREGSLYRDLLGRTVSPQVREQLRQSFASGSVHLEGQKVMATVLITDIRDFTVLSEKEDPTTILDWLNEYFGELAPIVAAEGGVINGFQGDALLAFFGILPFPLSPEKSAYHACQAALRMLGVIEQINARRAKRGEPPFITGIGINTGLVTAGGLGSTDRLHYTIIGDTVNTTQRLENLTRELGESGIIISEQTWLALQKAPAPFSVEPLGVRLLKGKSEAVPVYRLHASIEAVTEVSR